jgi:hypothetical protein
MSNQSICFAGLSREEEAAVVTCFKQANAATGNRWQLATENEAAVLVIDMDSMYGQMSLMKALGTSKVLVALTAASRADTDFLLQRPITAESIAGLLSQLESAPEAAPVPPEVPFVFEAPSAATEAARFDAPAWTDPPMAAAPAPGPAAVVPAATTLLEPSAAESAAPTPPADPRLADYLRPGALAGPVRLQAEGAPDLVLDPASRTSLGGSALKPLLPYCHVVLRESDLAQLDARELPAIASALGGTQPWSRLAWLCALTGGKGSLAEGYGANDRYKLQKWPQTEREFPKHFRIATVMMKGPALLTDIAEQSGASLAEVIDFVNASLATGVAEPDLPTAFAAEPGKGGLLGRFRR